MFSSLKNIENKMSLGFWGFVITLLSILLSIYFYFKTPKPDLNYIISSSSPVLDVREKVGKLDIVYDGKSLSSEKKALQLITLRVINQGDTAISKQSYDNLAPIGFEVLYGTFAEPPKIVAASQPYLEEYTTIQEVTNSKITFSDVIIDAGHFFELKLLIMYTNGETPKIAPLGKIASLDEIDVIYDAKQLEEESFISSALFATTGIQLFRIIFYGIIFLLMFAAYFSIEERLSELKHVRKKKKLVQSYKNFKKEQISRRDEFFFDYYLRHGPTEIKLLSELLSKVNDDDKSIMTSEELQFESFNLGLTSEELLNEGIIVSKDSERYCTEPARYAVLISFVEYLKRQGEFDRKLASLEETNAEMQIVEDQMSNVSKDMSAIKFEQLKLQGAVALNEGNYEKGITYFSEYLKKYPDDPSALWKLACCQKRIGKTLLALESIEKAINNSTEISYLMHYNYACYLALNERDINEVIEALSQALQNDETNRVKEQVPTESDFESVRSIPEFIALAAQFGIELDK
ncbi:hypothetical protein NCCP2140_23840 [Pseudoalteromonas sp. NCCP-2140]|uniref:tetratricopeptide repeat protein n=1 Tax=Pseudoalteromonas sp. NCCP-2140 TaxID=2942288 RepID=UPI00203A9C22|nr:tetratricopeptide repeat protein [Pseudoalteromonas sp. NCCP-2140]GKW53331.1 hypothetical protein NCCP2140_23840 [Pseudoalteromonas sp. NCCP-2140]